MRPLRMLFGCFALFMALLAAAQQANVDVWGCATCSLVKDYAFSSYLAYGGPILLAALCFGLFKEVKWAPIVAIAGALAGLGLSFLMVSRGTICEICLLTHSSLIALALSFMPRAGTAVSIGAFVLGVGFTGTGGWTNLQESILRASVFVPRPYEAPIKDGETVYVVFSDPECSRCRLLEQDMLKGLPPGVRVVHRWNLLPHGMYRSIRAATLIESLANDDPKKAEEFRIRLTQEWQPLSDEVLLSIAKKMGLESYAKSALANPQLKLLTWISDDARMASELGFEQLPAVAKVGPPDVQGVRTMRPATVEAVKLRK